MICSRKSKVHGLSAAMCRGDIFTVIARCEIQIEKTEIWDKHKNKLMRESYFSPFKDQQTALHVFCNKYYYKQH